MSTQPLPDAFVARSTSHEDRVRNAPLSRASAFLAAGLLLAACGGGGGGAVVPGGSPPPDPSTFTYPPGFVPSPAGFFIDSNEGGLDNEPQLLTVQWGRLVDIFDLDAATGTRTLQHRDFVVGEDIRTDGVDFQLDINPVTQQSSLVILHKAGTVNYDAAFGRLETNLGPILPKSDQLGELPPFSFIPRNAALVLTFSDLLDHDSVGPGTIKLQVGTPAELPYEPRIVIDPNHGGLYQTANGPEFRSSRIILDTTVSEIESEGTSAPINSIGLPAAITLSLANVSLRIPTVANPGVGQFSVLQNASAHPLSAVSSAPADFSSPTQDLVRAMRSGGETSITGDENNGFLLDLNAPQLLGSQPITISSVSPDPNAPAGNFLCNFEFLSISCGQAPSVGDVIEQAGVFAEVTQGAGAPSAGVVNDVRVRLISGDASQFTAGQALFNTVFESSDNQNCFVLFSPTPDQFPNAAVAPMSQIVLRFSEPMDPRSVTAFDSFLVTRTANPLTLNDYVVGEVLSSPDLREFRFSPTLPFAHSFEVAEQYYVTLGSGEIGITDLAGNQLSQTVPQITFSLDPAADQQRNGSIVMRFGDVDEDGSGNPEWRGQILYDLDNAIVRPRPVSRFPALADRSQPIPSLMIPFPPGIQTPLSPLGSRLMTLYRYFDVGFTPLDESTHNLDIEGLSWSPIGGQVVFDLYDLYEIRLGHSRFLPDEIVNPTSLLPTAPNSGLAAGSFDQNTAEGTVATVVHPREKGYSVNPLDMFQASSGTNFLPFPLNRDGDLSDNLYFTWRDTAVQALGAPNGKGFEPQILEAAGLIPGGSFGQLARPGFVPTIGLPLLMEHRCFPDDSALGLNALDISLAINSSARPNFRVYSTGGFDTNQNAVQKNPDLETSPSGGFNPNSNPPGKKTPAADNSFYIGQLDIVTRVSRAHSIWFDADESANPDYLEPVMEPTLEEQPNGTDVILAYRGAFTVETTTDGMPAENAADLDVYGDLADNDGSGLAGDPESKNNGIDFPPLEGNPPGEDEDVTWHDSIHDIDGLQFIQVRLSFINNTESELNPELSALGIAFEKLN